MRRDILKIVANIGLEAFFPRRCCACSRYFRGSRTSVASAAGGFAARLADFVCPECGPRFKPVSSPLCFYCGAPFESAHGLDHACPDCQRRPPDFNAARAVGLYEGSLQKVIHHFKYRGNDRLADPLGRLLWDALLSLWELGSIDRIIPVPLHEKRLRQRGFNQAGLLVRRWPSLASAHALPFEPDRIDDRTLVRYADTPPQTGLNRTQRKVNLRHAFNLTDPRAVRDQSILLVDDVMTTGATVGACAHVLLQAGAREVRVLTVARAMR